MALLLASPISAFAQTAENPTDTYIVTEQTTCTNTSGSSSPGSLGAQGPSNVIKTPEDDAAGLGNFPMEILKTAYFQILRPNGMPQQQPTVYASGLLLDAGRYSFTFDTLGYCKNAVLSKRIGNTYDKTPVMCFYAPGANNKYALCDSRYPGIPSYELSAIGNSVEGIVLTYQKTVDQPPTITANDITIEQDSNFNPLDGVTASDPEDGDITKSVKVQSGQVDATTPGTYTLTYEVTDSGGNTATATRTVTVKANTGNTIACAPQTGDPAASIWQRLTLFSAIACVGLGVMILRMNGTRRKHSI